MGAYAEGFFLAFWDLAAAGGLLTTAFATWASLRSRSELFLHAEGPLIEPFISLAAIESYYPHSHNAVPKLHSFVSVPVSGNIDNRLPDARSYHRVGTSPRGLAQSRRQFGWEICYRAVRVQSDHSRMPGKAEVPDLQSLLPRLFRYWFRLPRAPSPGTLRDLLKHRRKYWLGGDWGGAAADEIC